MPLRQLLFSVKTEEHPPCAIPRSGEIRALIGRPERTPSEITFLPFFRKKEANHIFQKKQSKEHLRGRASAVDLFLKFRSVITTYVLLRICTGRKMYLGAGEDLGKIICTDYTTLIGNVNTVCTSTLNPNGFCIAVPNGREQQGNAHRRPYSTSVRPPTRKTLRARSFVATAVCTRTDFSCRHLFSWRAPSLFLWPPRVPT